jgi:hypothetical protein
VVCPRILRAHIEKFTLHRNPENLSSNSILLAQASEVTHRYSFPERVGEAWPSKWSAAVTFLSLAPGDQLQSSYGALPSMLKVCIIRGAYSQEAPTLNVGHNGAKPERYR